MLCNAGARESPRAALALGAEPLFRSTRCLPYWEAIMKPITILGAVLIIAGVAGLFLGHFSYSQTTPVLKAGPLQINSQEDHTVWIPTLAGVVVVLAGLGLVFAGRRST